jgi:hypothetical protein
MAGMAQFESADLFGIALSSVRLKPGGSPKRTVAGEVRKRRQIATLNLCGFVHPTGVVLEALPDLRPATYEMSGLHLPA